MIPQTGEYIFKEQYNKWRKGKKDPVVFFLFLLPSSDQQHGIGDATLIVIYTGFLT